MIRCRNGDLLVLWMLFVVNLDSKEVLQGPTYREFLIYSSEHFGSYLLSFVRLDFDEKVDFIVLICVYVCSLWTCIADLSFVSNLFLFFLYIGRSPSLTDELYTYYLHSLAHGEHILVVLLNRMCRFVVHILNSFLIYNIRNIFPFDLRLALVMVKM